jgi:hypothetical protein
MRWHLKLQRIGRRGQTIAEPKDVIDVDVGCGVVEDIKKFVA